MSADHTFNFVVKIFKKYFKKFKKIKKSKNV